MRIAILSYRNLNVFLNNEVRCTKYDVRDMPSVARLILCLIILLFLWVPAGQTAETSAVLPPPQSEDVFSNALENIPSKEVETKYACFYASKGVEIPASLISNFDRIFVRVANFFRVEVDSYKVLVCVVDYETLQQMYNSNRETPIVVAAFYDPHLDSIFFTPRYMDDYYIAHELIHYFMDRYNENVAISIGKLISQKIPRHYFSLLRRNPLPVFDGKHVPKVAAEKCASEDEKNTQSTKLWKAK